MITLKPFKKNHTSRIRKPKKWCTYDIEGHEWIKHVVSALFVKHDEYDEDLVFFKSVNEFIKYIMRKECDIEEVYCHFGAIYDFLFILDDCFKTGHADVVDMIPRGNGLLMFTIQRGDKIVTFKDSSAILPFGLDSITKNFGVKHLKMKMDRTKITHDTPEVRTYLESDVKGLYESIEKYMEWKPIKEVGMKSTIASQSIQILRKYLPTEIPSLSKQCDSFIRQGYFGGRTEIYKPVYDTPKKQLNVYDINSLYPYCMKAFDYPVIPKKFDDDYELGRGVGYVDCVVKIPEMYSPPLPVVQKIHKAVKLIFPTGTVRGVWSTLELEYAASLGVKITKVYKFLEFHKPVPVFREFVDVMYDIRCKSEKNSVDNTLSKLILNSCYGRTGLNRLRESLVFDEGQVGFKPLYELAGKSGEVIRIGKKVDYAQNSFSHVGIAAWVTSAARITNHKKQAELNFNVWYTDTDSFFTPQKLKTSEGLGELKLEYAIDRACFLLPKTYLLETHEDIFKYIEESGNEVRTNKKLAMKGFDNKVINGFTFDDFAQAIEGDLKRLKVNTKGKMARMRAAWSRGEVLKVMDDSTKQIRSRYDKRRIIKTRSGGYDTEPLIVKNGKVMNI